MDLSPFPFQGPLEPDQVTGRRVLLDHLAEQVQSRRVTALLGPRRYGKTSVLRRLASQHPAAATVWIDLYEVASMADVATRFDQGLADIADGPFLRAARASAATLSLNLGLVKVELRSGPASRPDPSLALSALLEVLVAAASRHDTILALDEFSFISRVPSAAGQLRTALQQHYRSLGIIFAGSQPSMMRSLFTERTEPFYGQAELVDIGPLDLSAVEAVIATGFESTGRRPGHTASLVWGLAEGHPMRTMQLADAVWRLTDRGGEVSDGTWAAALAEVRAREDESLERLFTQMGDSDKAVLRAVAHTGSVWRADGQLLGLSGGTAAASQRRLTDRGDLIASGAGIAVTDPLMADWIRRRFAL